MDEREFELVNIVGAQLAANQRQLSRQMNLSLGMTNMLLKRLVTKGYIRIQQLDRRKVQYILTPKGFAEKMHKSIKYTLKTINSIGLIKKQLVTILKEVYEQGPAKKFYILGESDLAGLVIGTLQEHFRQNSIIIKSFLEAKPDGIILVCKEEENLEAKGLKVVNIVEELAKLHNGLEDG